MKSRMPTLASCAWSIGAKSCGHTISMRASMPLRDIGLLGVEMGEPGGVWVAAGAGPSAPIDHTPAAAVAMKIPPGTAWLTARPKPRLSPTPRPAFCQLSPLSVLRYTPPPSRVAHRSPGDRSSETNAMMLLPAGKPLLAGCQSCVALLQRMIPFPLTPAKSVTGDALSGGMPDVESHRTCWPSSPNGSQEVPPSRLSSTPRSVPTQTRDPSVGWTAIPSTASGGSPCEGATRIVAHVSPRSRLTNPGLPST